SVAIPEHSRSSMPTHRSLLPPAEQRIVMMSHRLLFLSIAGLSVLAACGAPSTDGSSERAVASTVERAPGEAVTVVDTVIEATLDAAGVAEPIAQSTLSTKLMGTVTAVLVREGDRVDAGQPLVRIDARDLAAKQSQV